jgi:hypothetical protein
MIQEDLLVKVTDKLHRLKISYMITGGIAVIFYGRPRLTHDFDLVVMIKPEQIPSLMKAFKDEFYISQEAIQNALDTQSMFNMIHFDSGIKVDFWIIQASEFDRKRFERRQKHRYGGKEICFSSPEDVILIKILWFKESEIQKHLEDALGILEIQQNLDFDYLKTWADKLGIQSLLKGLLKRISN